MTEEIEVADKESKDESQKGAERTAPKVKWDDSKMRSTYANVCNVSSTREEVTLLFGTNQTWSVGQKELTVELSDRVILNPYAAKRLAILLGRVVKEYEGRFGELGVEGAPVSGGGTVN